MHIFVLHAPHKFIWAVEALLCFHNVLSSWYIDEVVGATTFVNRKLNWSREYVEVLSEAFDGKLEISAKGLVQTIECWTVVSFVWKAWLLHISTILLLDAFALFHFSPLCLNHFTFQCVCSINPLWNFALHFSNSFTLCCGLPTHFCRHWVLLHIHQELFTMMYLYTSICHSFTRISLF